MMLTILILATLIITASLGLYIAFVMSEGKDERGQTIIARASQIAFIFILLGFVFQGVYIHFAAPSVDEISLMITIWMAFVFASNGFSIVFLNKRM